MNANAFARSCTLGIILLSFTPTASSKEPTIADRLNNCGRIIVVQPQTLNNRLQRQIELPTTMTEDSIVDERVIVSPIAPKVRAGYRIQVFDDNNVRTAKQEAQNRKNQIQSKFPYLNAYVSFNSPYWRVKVGDFTTRSEAEAIMAEIRQQFPSMAQSLRIVRDRIKQQ